MGEAKTKRRAHGEILKRYPHCIYCGHPASTIEHMPPRMMFYEKLRPKGLEFPCCDVCNSATKHADLVASLLARLWPDATTETGN